MTVGTLPTKSVNVRRIEYHNTATTQAAVVYDDPMDFTTTDVIDPVMRDDPKIIVTSYTWDFYKHCWIA